MLRRRHILYALIFVAATLALQHGIVGQVSQWSSQNIHKISKNKLDSKKIVNHFYESLPMHQIDVMVDLFGQMGTHLHMIGMACILKLFAAKLDPRVYVKLHYNLEGNRERSIRIREDISTCFPNFKDADFYDPDDNSRKKIIEEQQQYGIRNLVSANDNAEVELRMQQKIDFMINKEFNSSGMVESFPYLHSISFIPPVLIDRYYDDLTKLFEFNDASCCNEVPDADETVVHIRGFYAEYNEEYLLRKGYTELNPHQMANEMLSHLQPGDKVALVAPSMELSFLYKSELEKKGIKVRSLSQNRVQDFCFLMKATKELVGHYQSTFVFWAAILSTSVKKVSLYNAKCIICRKSPLMDHRYNWKHPKLKGLFQYPEFDYNPV